MIRLAIRVARDRAELVLAELAELAPNGLEERDVDAETVEFALYGAPGELPPLPGLRAAAGGALVDVSTTELPDDWEDRWRTWHPAVVVEAGGRSLRVRPPWEEPRPGSIDVAIEPAQAFGTGAHETTRLSLALLLEIEPGGALADWGCGSGVLAIAAAKLGFGPVRACDVEAASVAATRDGARDNGVEVEVSRCDLRREPGPYAPTVTANLVRPLLLEVATRMERGPDTLIVSGLLRHEADEVSAAFGGMRETARREGGEWAALRLEAGMIGFDDVGAAAERIEGITHRTPVLTSRALDEATGAQVFLKAENLQRAGAFKFRGACNAVAALHRSDAPRGFASVSSGNHAQALALAARLHDARATILMPDDAPPSKLAATRGYGAEVIGFDRYASDREQLLAELVAERDLIAVHPYDDPFVMAGQGTVALELLEQAPELDLLLVCVGGGGLIAGCATAAAQLSPGTRVIGVEPEAGDDTRRSLAAGKRVRIPVPRTIADGQQLPIPGELTFEVTRRLVHEVTVASDAEIVAAMTFLFERLKTVVEPSGACALAALLAGRVPARGLRVGVTLSGGNVDTRRFAQLVAE